MIDPSLSGNATFCPDSVKILCMLIWRVLPFLQRISANGRGLRELPFGSSFRVLVPGLARSLSSVTAKVDWVFETVYQLAAPTYYRTLACILPEQLRL